MKAQKLQTVREFLCWSFSHSCVGENNMCNSCFDVLGSLLYNTWSCDYYDGVPFPGQFHSSVSGWSHANILLLVWRGSGVPSRIFVRHFAIDIIWKNVHKYWMLIEGMQNLVSQQLFVQRDSLSHFCQLFCAYTKSKKHSCPTPDSLPPFKRAWEWVCGMVWKLGMEPDLMEWGHTIVCVHFGE